MNDKIQTAVKHWQSVCRQFEYETGGFTRCLHEMTADELTGIKPVSLWFLDFAPFMFKITPPKEHARLRTMIAYLTALQGFQALAWEAKQTEFETKLENVKKWVRSNQT